MRDIVIVRAKGVGLRRSSDAYSFRLVAGRRNDGNFGVHRSGLVRIIFFSAAFVGNFKQRCTLPAVVCNGAVTSLNSRKASVAVPKGGLVGIQKALGIC